MTVRAPRSHRFVGLALSTVRKLEAKLPAVINVRAATSNCLLAVVPELNSSSALIADRCTCDFALPIPYRKQSFVQQLMHLLGTHCIVHVQTGF